VRKKGKALKKGGWRFFRQKLMRWKRDLKVQGVNKKSFLFRVLIWEEGSGANKRQSKMRNRKKQSQRLDIMAPILSSDRLYSKRGGTDRSKMENAAPHSSTNDEGWLEFQ